MISCDISLCNPPYNTAINRKAWMQPYKNNGILNDHIHQKQSHCRKRPVRLAYQPPASSTFLSKQTSHQQPANSTFLSEQISTRHQPPAKRTG
jgi:hypothetical protein